MPKGWSFNWESMATREKGNLETRCMESLLVVYVLRVSWLSLIRRCQNTVLVPIRGANDQQALP